MTSLHEGVEEAGTAEVGVRSWRSEDGVALAGELPACRGPAGGTSRVQFAFTSGEERLGPIKGGCGLFGFLPRCSRFIHSQFSFYFILSGVKAFFF